MAINLMLLNGYNLNLCQIVLVIVIQKFRYLAIHLNNNLCLRTQKLLKRKRRERSLRQYPKKNMSLSYSSNKMI